MFYIGKIEFSVMDKTFNYGDLLQILFFQIINNENFQVQLIGKEINGDISLLACWH